MKLLKVLLISLLFSGCGPLTPHVDVQASGSVNTSGTITIDLANLNTFFYQTCLSLLGSSATPQQINDCESGVSSTFNNTIGTTVHQ